MKQTLLMATILMTVMLPAATAAAGVLFPTPLHLTREVEDPLSGTTARIEEYCVGSRVISIRGDRTSIADYETGELVEIDRAAGTYSVTRFERIAALQNPGGASKRASRAVERFELQRRGVRGVGARSGEAFEAEIRASGGERQRVEVVIDRSVALSKDAVEVLTGAAWPMQRGPESEIALRAAAGEVAAGRTATVRYGLPIEHVVTFEIDGETLRTVNRIVRVGSELPPPELIAIPPGAREVPSPIIERERLLEELDRLPTKVQP